MAGTLGAKAMLMTQYRELNDEKWLNIELKNDSIFTWVVAIMIVNSDSCFDGGYFKAEIKFPNNYPYSPPEFKFLRPPFHPNIYKDGRVCISILHAPGDDEMSGESAAERWNPINGVEPVLRSILLLLEEPNISSPANVDAGVMYRDDRQSYTKRAKADVERSKTDIPKGFTMPTYVDMVSTPPAKIEDDEDFWNESEAEDDFGGSDSSGEGNDEMQDFDEDGEEQEFDSEDDIKATQP